MLHLHNGDSSANILRESGLPGEHLAWREALISGPTPQNLSAEEWIRVRAAHLAEAYDVSPEDCTRNLLEQDRALSDFSQHEEVVLWFEHDLFCQLHLIYLLQWFATRELGETKLSLVCVDSFPGVEDFRGLGQLSPPQMASLFETRSEVSAAQLNLAVAAWQAY
ncbi:MAG: RNA polymerase subunit sigma, partial [Pyrinomonadaceae bacterium]|nr:RNA polymerase subunit sigma [Pyrinomonadaceae bacterium]